MGESVHTYFIQSGGELLKKSKTYLLIGVFLLGLVIFIYPLLSNFVLNRNNVKIISNYDETIMKMNKENIEREKKKAEKYNEDLEKGDIDYKDAFNEEGASVNSYFDALDVGETIGYLDIPTVDINLPIYHGVNDDVLSKGAGHVPISSLPIGGEGTHTMLTAHRGLPSAKMFRDLKKIELGDRFYINTLGEKLAYEVYDIHIVLPDETESLQIEPDRDVTTLITCDPYMINTHRLLVHGKRIDLVEENNFLNLETEELEIKNDSINLYIVGSVFLLIVLAVITLNIMNRKKDRN